MKRICLVLTMAIFFVFTVGSFAADTSDAKKQEEKARLEAVMKYLEGERQQLIDAYTAIRQRVIYNDQEIKKTQQHLKALESQKEGKK